VYSAAARWLSMLRPTAQPRRTYKKVLGFQGEGPELKIFMSN
jgi:hypothetical protein